jgi:hypothetical protein
VLVLTEGVVPYLTETDVTGLAGDLRREEKTRYWITDYFSPQAIRSGDKLRAKFMRNAPFQFKPADWFGFFGALGWRPAEGALRLGRRREAQAAHPAAVTREAVTGACGPVRLARPSGRHEALRSLYVPRSGLSRLAAELVPVMASNHRRHPMTKPASDGSMAPHGDQEAN